MATTWAGLFALGGKKDQATEESEGINRGRRRETVVSYEGAACGKKAGHQRRNLKSGEKKNKEGKGKPY